MGLHRCETAAGTWISVDRRLCQSTCRVHSCKGCIGMAPAKWFGPSAALRAVFWYKQWAPTIHTHLAALQGPRACAAGPPSPGPRRRDGCAPRHCLAAGWLMQPASPALPGAVVLWATRPELPTVCHVLLLAQVPSQCNLSSSKGACSGMDAPAARSCCDQALPRNQRTLCTLPLCAVEGTPRRLAVIVHELAARQSNSAERVRGPNAKVRGGSGRGGSGQPCCNVFRCVPLAHPAGCV